MEHVSISEIDRMTSPASVKKPLTEALGATDVAINYYELAPDETLAFGYHADPYQEEIFYVISGTLTVETEGGETAVGTGEAIRFSPCEYHQGTNHSGERVVILALGAPRVETPDDEFAADVLRACPDCGERTSQTRVEDGNTIRTRCRICGTVTGKYTQPSPE